MVVRHSALVGERYFEPGGRDSLYSVRSVTKSVMSLLVAAAIQRGVFSDVRTTLAAILVPRPTALDATKGAITIEDVLTMTSGFDIEYPVAKRNKSAGQTRRPAPLSNPRADQLVSRRRGACTTPRAFHDATHSMPRSATPALTPSQSKNTFSRPSPTIGNAATRHHPG